MIFNGKVHMKFSCHQTQVSIFGEFASCVPIVMSLMSSESESELAAEVAPFRNKINKLLILITIRNNIKYKSKQAKKELKNKFRIQVIKIKMISE